MKQENKVFALLAGIFVMVGCSYSLFITVRNLFRTLGNPMSFFINFLSVSLWILTLLAGLFLLLRKVKASSILLIIAAGLLLIHQILYTIQSTSHGYFNGLSLTTNLLAMLSIASLGVALLLKKVPAMITAFVSAFFRLVVLTINIIRNPPRSGMGVFFLLCMLLLIGGAVFAGLYMKDRAEKAAAAPGYAAYGRPVYPQAYPQGYPQVYQQPQYQQPQYQQPQYQQPQCYQPPQYQPQSYQQPQQYQQLQYQPQSYQPQQYQQPENNASDGKY